MSLLVKTLEINDTNDTLNLKDIKGKRVEIILLNEKILIEVLKLNNKRDIEEKIENFIKDRFFNYNPLVHYEILKYNKELFLIVYFIGCDEKFKTLLYESEKFSLSFPEIKRKNISIFNKAIFEIREFKISIYIKGKLVLLKGFEESNIIKVIDESLKVIEKDFKITLKDFVFKIQKKHLKEEVYNLVEGSKLKEVRGD